MEKVPELVKQPEPLATELLKEVKASRKCWVAVSIIELIIIVVMALLFYFYSTSPIDEHAVEIENESGNASYIGNDMNGDFNYGENQSYSQAEGSAS